MNVKTFPKHFHNGSEGNVCESFSPENRGNLVICVNLR